MANQVCVGTELKLNIHIEPIDGVTMDGYDFTVQFYCSPMRKVELKKHQAIRIDENNYLYRVDSKSVGPGRLLCRVVAEIPDGDFDDGLRTEVIIIDAGVDLFAAPLFFDDRLNH